jgi:alpha-galactosidase
MTYTRQNLFLIFTLDPGRGTWSLADQQRQGPWVDGVDMSVRYRQRLGEYRVALNNLHLKAENERVNTIHGPAYTFEFVTAQDSRGVRCSINFSIPENYPLLLWKFTLENLGKHPIRVDRLELLNIGFRYASNSGFSPTYLGPLQREVTGHLILSAGGGDPAFFSNGWQSWSSTGAYGWQERQRRTRLRFFTEPMRINAGTPQPRGSGLFSSDMFGIIGDRKHRRGLLAGFLSQKQHFGSLEALLIPSSPAMRMWANGDKARLDPGHKITTDWACLNYILLDSADPLGVYIEAVARENEIRNFKKEDIPVGWCSWYHFFQKVHEQDIRSNLEEISRIRKDLPLELVQIDDGFETQIGDWDSFSTSFPAGVAPLAAEIRQKGFTPGLWLAPFIVHPKSKLADQHPEWLLRGQLGRPVNAGYIWDTFTTGLDLTAPGALEYAVATVSRAVHEWDFPFLKLDFLYAAALPGRYQDPTQTRAQVLRKGLEALRKEAGPEAALLGCGCPLGSALGLVDSMRIGSDVDIRWRPVYKGVNFVFQDEPDMPSARNAIQNAITRTPMHRRWWVNDPDCLLLRPSTFLSEAEVRTLASVIAMSGGSMLISDHLPEVPPERLQIARTLLPILGERPHVLDWFDHATPSRMQINLKGPAGEWHLLGMFNWEDNPRDIALRLSDFYLNPEQIYLARSFWDGMVYEVGRKTNQPNSREELMLESISPHGAVILALRPKRSQPQYLGGNLHISQGMELTEWVLDGKQHLKLKLERPGKWHGQIDLSLPAPPVEVWFADRAAEAKQKDCFAANIYEIEADFQNSLEISLKF